MISSTELKICHFRLKWMLEVRKANHAMYCINERALRIVYKDNVSSHFEELLVRMVSAICIREIFCFKPFMV